jgi:hypothetical protein
MATELRSSPRFKAAKSTRAIGSPPQATRTWERRLRVGLGLHLLQALLAVIFESAVGMVLLVAARLFPGVVGIQACTPRTSVGPEVFRA